MGDGRECETCINGPDHFTGEGPLTIAAVRGAPFDTCTELAQSNYRPSPTDTANALSRRGRSRRCPLPLPAPRPLALRADSWVTVGRSPKTGLLNQSDLATREPVGCWPLANVRKLTHSGERP